MIAIEVDFLTGRYVATSFNDRRVAEWPPHPARFFSALVAVWAEDDLDRDVANAIDRLARAGDPEILASEAFPRTVLHVYVPGIGGSLMARTYEALNDVERSRFALDAAEAIGDAKAVTRARKLLDGANERFQRSADREINDVEDTQDSAISTALRLLPAGRGKQPRTFPSVRPLIPKVTFIWRDAEFSPAIRSSLSALLARVHRLGHSTSLVACRLLDDLPETSGERACWVPDDDGERILRVVSEGQRERLEVAYRQHAGVEPRVLPTVFQRYARRTRETARRVQQTVFGTDWLVFREVASERPRVGVRLTLAPDLARAVRNSLMHYADDPPSAMITGHTTDGRPSESAHAAFVALPDAGHYHASGTVLGIAIVLPGTSDQDERLALMRALGRWEMDCNGGPLPLRLGRAGVVWIERVMNDDSRVALRSDTWCRPTHHWASVTPIALDENPGNLTASNPDVAERAVAAAQDIIVQSCKRIGLPRPRVVEVHRRSIFDGPPSARQFMPFPRKPGALRRVCVHAELIFDVPVRGPVLLGAGRYQGLGLLRPVRSGQPG